MTACVLRCVIILVGRVLITLVRPVDLPMYTITQAGDQCSLGLFVALLKGLESGRLFKQLYPLRRCCLGEF